MESDRNSAREHSKKLRQELVSYVPSSKEDTAIDSLFKAPYEKKQRDDVLDEFSSLYTQHNLVEPLYNFYTLYIIHDQSDILGECVEAYAENIDGFGYQLQYLGEDQTKKSEKEIADEQMLKDFFDHANEKESWVKIRKAMRKDLEILGNGAFEIVRNVAGKPGMVYHIPFKSIRCTKVHPDPVDVQVVMKRGGEHIKVRVRKYFRKWAQVKEGGSVLTWFKSYGDPRVMNALTGEFEKVVRKDSKTGSYINDAGDPVQIATEIKQYKIGGVGQAYGVPRWMGDVPDVIGRRSAQYINYDLMNSQGIPPLVIMVSGGSLTDESMLELKSVVRSMRGKEKWNKVALLESTPENTGLEDRGNAKIELKNLTEYRKDDLMFEKYLKNTEETIRHTYRLPRMYVGSSIAFCYSEDTETLTQNGWKYYTNVTQDDLIATVNPDTGEFEYQKAIKGCFVFDYEGDMYHFKNTAIDTLVTPNHKMFLSLRRGAPWQKLEAKEIFKTENPNYRVKFKVSTERNTLEDIETFEMPHILRRTERVIGNRYIDMNTFLMFTGLFIGDGCTETREHYYGITISVKKQRKIEALMQITKEFVGLEGFKLSIYKKSSGHVTFNLYDKWLYRWLRENCGKYSWEKKIPKCFMSLNTRQSKCLLRGLIFSDGSLTTRGMVHSMDNLPEACVYNTISLKLAEQVQLLGFRCGYQSVLAESVEIRPNCHDLYHVNLKKEDSISIHNFQHEVVPYKGKVYCFEVPNHLFVTRRNGKIGIHGNTHSTSVVARITAEEQVFMPGRSDFDEGVNNEIINGEFGIYEWKYTSKGPKIVGSKELAAGVDTFSKIGAFTINHAIAMANEAFGLQMSTFSEKWADYPIPLVLELLKLGMLGEIDAITGKTTPPGNSELRVIRGNVAKMEKVSDKIMDSDIFSKEEKDLYKRLLTIQYAMTSKVTEEEEVGHV